MPARDEESSIGRLLDSLALQTRRPDGVVIVDAGSVDRTRDIVREYARRGPLAIDLVEAGPSFPGRARNLGVERVAGGIVAFLDAGVRIEADWLQRLVAPFDDDGAVDVVYGSYEPVLDTLFQHAAAVTWVDPRNSQRAIRAESVASLAVRKRAWSDPLKFREDLRSAEDLLFKDHLRESGLRCADAPGAVIYWELPVRARDVFRKFFNYSRDSIAAGLARRWQMAVATMYVALLTTIAASWLLFRTPVLLVVIVALFYLIRAAVYARRKSEFVGHGLQPLAIVALTGVVVSIVDAAMFAGAARWAADAVRSARASR